MSTETALNYNMDLPDLGLTKDGKTKSEGIGILVDMAKHGKIDPWHIDILDVTEKYLERLFAMELNEMVFTVVNESIEYLTKKGKKISPVTKLFLDELKMNIA